jgi:hypothetical protein
VTTFQSAHFFGRVDIRTDTPLPTPPDADMTAWAAQVVTNGGTVSAGRKTLVSDLIAGLKSDGIWTKLDRLWIFAAENTQSALTDLKGLDLATENNTPTFTVDRGYVCDSNKFLGSTFNPATDGVNLTTNSISVGAWMRILATDGSMGNTIAWAPCGASDGAQEITLIQKSAAFGGTSGVILPNVNISGTANVTGLIHGNRSGASAAEFYQNGVQTATSGNASAALVSREQYMGAENNNGAGATGDGDGQVSIVFYGGSLTGVEAGNIYTRLQTYMTAVGA